MNYFIKKSEYSTKEENYTINLPSSKSEANRALIIQALTQSGVPEVNNLAAARDTQTLKRLLDNSASEILFDVIDAGTTMRFLTAYLALTTEQTVEITGTERMKERPISILVASLNALGCHITYKEKEGYPPLVISNFGQQQIDEIAIAGNVSSQYISALLMIAPLLPLGLTIKITAPVYSKPYINMTIGLMQKSGISVKSDENVLKIAPGAYTAMQHTVESDWSGASYWFSLVALSEPGTQMLLKGLKQKSLQGDQAITEIMQKLGVTTNYNDEGIILLKNDSTLPELLTIDFRDFPDLAQTVVACCIVLKVNLKMTGLESLRIKETDRIDALNNEISKFGCSLIESSTGQWVMNADNFEVQHNTTINTYEDHRMAMSFAPLAAKFPLIIEEIEVVNKSYPTFWTDLASVGFELEQQ